MENAAQRSLRMRCAIRGLIRYSGKEERLINAPVLQRLRGIHQLAIAYHVYPGCRHTRFEHSIGVVHIAGRMAEHLNCTEEEVRIARLAGLLHDCGHGPFSHVSEQLLEKLTVNAPHNAPRNKLHEQVTVDMVRYSPDVAAILDEEERNDVIEVLDTISCPERTVLRDIVSGPLDADKLDYLLRDSHYAGVKYGVFDLDRVIESLCRVDMDGGEEQVGIVEDGIQTIEQVLFARYHMTTQVYSHRIRAITDAMIVNGVLAAVAEGAKEIEQLFQYDASDPSAFVQHYFTFDDRRLTDRILTLPDGSLVKELFQRLTERRLLKEVVRLEVSEHLGDAVFVRDLAESLRSDSERSKHEEVLADLLHVREGSVIVDYQSLSNPTYRAPGPTITLKDIVVRTKTRGRRLFDQESLLFGGHAGDPRKEYLCVYAPVDIEDREQRTDRIGELSKVVQNHFGIEKEKAHGHG